MENPSCSVGFSNVRGGAYSPSCLVVGCAKRVLATACSVLLCLLVIRLSTFICAT